MCLVQREYFTFLIPQLSKKALQIHSYMCTWPEVRLSVVNMPHQWGECKCCECTFSMVFSSISKGSHGTGLYCKMLPWKSLFFLGRPYSQSLRFPSLQEGGGDVYPSQNWEYCRPNDVHIPKFWSMLGHNHPSEWMLLLGPPTRPHWSGILNGLRIRRGKPPC